MAQGLVVRPGQYVVSYREGDEGARSTVPQTGSPPVRAAQNYREADRREAEAPTHQSLSLVVRCWRQW